MGCTVADEISICVGTPADYAALADFHYRSHHAGAVVRVWAAVHEGDRQPPRVVGVLTESLPALACTLRDVATQGRYRVADRRLAAALLNRELRTISRVVIHPQFRSLGLAVRLVRHALAHAQTPYVEALAVMGRVHPFFAQAGMQAYDRPADEKSTRLLAALTYVGLSALELCDDATWKAKVAAATMTDRAFLVRELHRFAGARVEMIPRCGEERDHVVEALVEFARKHLLSQPVYYLWRRDG